MKDTLPHSFGSLRRSAGVLAAEGGFYGLSSVRPRVHSNGLVIDWILIIPPIIELESRQAGLVTIVDPA